MNNKVNSSKPQGKKKQFIIFGACSVFALVLCLVTLVITVKNVEKENNSQQAVEETQSKTSLKGEKEELVDYIKELTDYTQSNKFVKVNAYTDIKIDDSKIAVNGEVDGKDAKLVAFLKNQFIGTVDSLYKDDFNGTFGTVYEDMPVVDLGLSEAAEYNFSQGLTDESGNPAFDDEGNLIDKDYYFITYTVKGDKIASPEEKKAFEIDRIPDVKGEITKALSSVCKINDLKYSADDFAIKLKINRLTDEIYTLEIKRVYSVTMDIDFVNELKVFGNKTIDLEYEVNQVYEYFYAGVALSQSELFIEKGDEAVLTVNAVIEDDSEYEVEFISSDESVVTVDEMGYVNGISESEKPVTVTVKLKYLEKTFTDECTVYVGSSGNK